MSYLLWAPLTAEVKCNLEKEDNSAPPKQDFAAFAKDFIDDKLADALLYGGAYREEVIRPSVQARALHRHRVKLPCRQQDMRARRLPTTRPSSSPTVSAATC